MTKKESYKIVAAQGEWQVRQYPGSTGYQLWKNGEFWTFMPTLETALAWIK